MSLEENNIESNKSVKTIIKGSVISIIITLILLVIFSAILTYTNVPESTIFPVIVVITGISILIGSSMGNMNIRKNGLLNGGIIGAIYILCIYLLSSIISGNFALNINSIIIIVSGILARMLRRNNRSEF